MIDSPERKRNRRAPREYEVHDEFSTPAAAIVFGGIGLILLAGIFLGNSAWASFHGLLLGGVAVLMLCFRPSVSIPKSWWILGGVFSVAGAACFLPADWFYYPEWRTRLEKSGLNTGTMVVIQGRHAVEGFVIFVITVFVGLWLAGFRASASQLRILALVFTAGVAGYTIISKIMLDRMVTGPLQGNENYGFFANRNHTATYLAMGSLCGLGCLVQALRDKRFVTLVLALVATGVCLWGVVGLSVSRSGVALVAVGGGAWLCLVGRQYLGSHGVKLIGLLTFAAIGGFLLNESRVKDRLLLSVDSIGSLVETGDDAATSGVPNPKSSPESVADVDFRIPTFSDTFDLIRDFKWTGIGANQFFFVFPEYRSRTSIENDYDSYHPESDWLWMVAECGLPATSALGALVCLAIWKAGGRIRKGKQRSQRAACLVAACVVPVHGLLDVPGHNLTLALSAAMLYSMSLPRSPGDQPAGPKSVWISRIASLLLIGFSACLLQGGIWPGFRTINGTRDLAFQESTRLYAEDQKWQSAILAGGRPYPQDSERELLAAAVAIMQSALRDLPLDRRNYHYLGFLALNFDDRHHLAEECYRKDLALAPSSIGSALSQAEAWSSTRPEKSRDLWQLALERAERVDRIKPGTRFSRKATLAKIREFGRIHPALAPYLPEGGN